MIFGKNDHPRIPCTVYFNNASKVYTNLGLRLQDRSFNAVLIRKLKIKWQIGDEEGQWNQGQGP